MWSTWSESAKSTWKQAVEKTGDALEKTGVAHGAKKKDEATTTTTTTTPPAGGDTEASGDAGGDDDAAKKSQDETKEAGDEKTKTESTTTEMGDDASPGNPVDIFKSFQSGWSSVLENTQKIVAKKPEPVSDEPITNVAGRYTEGEPNAAGGNKDIFKNFQTGWSSVMEQTKNSIKTAQSAVEAEQQKMAKRLHRARTAMQKRDIKLPLDVPALRDAQVVYITDRLITLSHPAMASSQNGEITAERKLAAVAHLLQRRHDGRYMVWNLSEVDFDSGMFDDQVLNFSFPGSPSPPLGLMLKLLVSIESWLKADERNVAVVHCLTGKGRTSTVLAAFLCWMGEAGFGDVYQALEYIAECKKISTEELTIPSQRRYASYFKNMLDGVRPSQPPLMLKRVIMSIAPKYAKGPPRESDGDKMDDMQPMGCAPYLQIFRAGALVHTAPASLHYQQSKEELPFCRATDGQISFQLNQIVQGDILLRCRHLTARKQRVSMFRAAFHTGYAPPNVMRLNKSHLDGACDDDRFPDDFYIDVIFEPADAEAATKAMQEGEEETTEEEHASVEAHGSKAAQALAGGGATVRASSYDVMLHRDSRFWDVIAKRNEAHAKDEQATSDPMYGPTVGRRRDFGAKKKSDDGEKAESPALQTFSIGNEFDFLPSDDPKPAAAVGPPKPFKKDTLMEALMGALNEEPDEEHETEEIVFHSDSGEDSKPQASSAPPSIGVPAPEKTATIAPQAESDTEAGGKDATSTEKKSVESAAAETANSAVSDDGAGDDDMDALLAEANLDMGDDDMDALLADVDGDDLDMDDLESFLSQK